MNWIEALKQWNASRGGRYTIPKKGSPEHAEVKELMQGSGKASGYVKLLYAKKILGRKPGDYDPAAVKDLREKKSDTRFRVGKIRNKSSTLVRQFGSKKEKAEFAAEQAEKQRARDERPPKPSKKVLQAVAKSVKAAQKEEEAEDMDFVPKPSRAEQIAAEARAARAALAAKKTPKGNPLEVMRAKEKEAARAQRAVKPVKDKKLEDAKMAEMEADLFGTGRKFTAKEAEADRKKMGLKKKGEKDKKSGVKETGQVSMMMRVGNHVMIAEPQAATIKVKGDPSSLQADIFAPEASSSRPAATTAAQAARKFSADELKVRPLSELFMTRPAKSLVEEQLAGKGCCWWMNHELHEF